MKKYHGANVQIYAAKWLAGYSVKDAWIAAGGKAKTENAKHTAAYRFNRRPDVKAEIEKRSKEISKRLEIEEDFEMKKTLKCLEECMKLKPKFSSCGEILRDENGAIVYEIDSKGASQFINLLCRMRGKYNDKTQVDLNLSDRSGWLSDVLSGIKNGE